MTIPSYISEAYNTSALMTGVNPQTGSLQAGIKIAEISAGVLMPASFSLILSVGPQTLPTLRTTGFSGSVHLFYAAFNVPRIDIKNNRMYFSDGSVEELVNTTDAYTFRYRKVKNIKITKKFDLYPTDKIYPWYLVEYKGGMTEYYDITGLLVRIVSPTGHYLEFSYSSSNMCNKIEAKTGTTDKTATADIAKEVLSKLEIIYTNGVPVSVTKTLNPAGTSPVIETAKIENKMVCKNPSWFGGCDPLDQEHYITSVQLANDERPYLFEYQEVTSPRPLSLNRIITPYGGVYSVTFHPRNTLKYGKVGTVMQYIPVVKSLQFTAQAIPDHTTESTLKAGDLFQAFSFTGENNFTGYSNAESYTPQTDRDNCLLKAESYTYTTVEAKGFRNYTLKITRTYNRFHLLTEEIKDYDHSEYFREKNVYTYGYMDKDLTTPGNIDAQNDARFAFWTIRTTTYEKIKNGAVEPGKTRSESWTREYDDWGNLTKEIKPSGIEDQYIYYSENGETGCDAAPAGLRCYLKTATVVGKQMPANKVNEYKYTKVSGNNSSFVLIEPPDYAGADKTVNVNPFALLPSEVKENSTLIKTSSYKPTGTTFIARMLTGVLTAVTNTVTAKLETVLNEEWVIDSDYTTLTHTRKIDSKNLSETNPVTQTRRIDDTVHRLADGRLTSRSVPNNEPTTGINTTTYGYDARNRLTEVRAFSNQAGYEESETMTYTPFSSETMSTTVARTRRKISETTSYNYKMLPVKMIRTVTGFFNPTSSYYYYDTNDTLARSEYIERTMISHTPESFSQIKTVNTFNHHPLYSKTYTAVGALFFQSKDPVLRSQTERADGSDIKFETTFNEYGEISSIRQYGTVVNKDEAVESIDQKLSSNTYDGFGRLIKSITHAESDSPEMPQYSQVDYEYDLFDRLTKEKVSRVSPQNPATNQKIIQTTNYTYNDDIANFNLAISITCQNESNNTIVNASRVYDGFSRLTKLTTNGKSSTNNIVTNYTYTNTIDDHPATVETENTSVGYIYDAITGLPTSMTMTNTTDTTDTTGTNHPLNTKANHTYTQDTKQPKTAKVYLVTDTALSNPLSQFDFTYDENEMVERIDYKCIKIDPTIQTSDRYITSKINYRRQSNGKPWGVTTTFQDTTIVNKFVSYDSVAALCNKVEFKLMQLNKSVIVDIEYVDSRNSYAIGKPEKITISFDGFFTDPAASTLNLSCGLGYDEFGRESKRLHSSNKNAGEVYVEQFYDAHSRVKERQVLIRKPAIPGTPPIPATLLQYNDKYTYSHDGSATQLSQSTKEKITQQQGGTPSSPELLSLFDYSFDTELKLNEINNMIGPEKETYTYVKDAVLLIATTATNSLFDFTYNSYGNVNTVTGTGEYEGETAVITYNAMNQPGVFNNFNHDETDATRMWSPTAYEYDAFNRVCKITTRPFPTAETSTSVFLIYEGDDVSAEIETSNTTDTAGMITASTVVSRCVYLRIESLLIGRFLETEVNTSAPKKYLDWYMTDSSGTVRGVTRYQYDVASTASDAAVTTFFDYSDYGARTEI